MEKLLAIISIICVLALASGAGENTPDERIVRLSPIEWDAVKKCVDTNGYCRIANQYTTIVITNGLSEVEHLFPLIEDRLERNPLRLEGKRKKKEPYTPEPVPYVGQGGW